MKTEELIVQLARSARPMTPLPHSGIRSARWVTVAGLVILAGSLIAGPREDIVSMLGQPRFLGSLAALAVTLAGGAFAAFALSVPGASRSPRQRALPVLSAAAWSAIWLVASVLAGTPAGQRTAAVHPACAVQVTASALIAGSILFVMVARAAPLRRFWTATVVSLAAVATGAALAQIACPLDDPHHQLIGHVAIALALAAGGVIVGRRALSRWERRDA